MLDDLDRELWKRGHRFVRYADDLRVFVRSERAAHRVLDSVTDVVERRLRLKVNREKSSVRHAADAALLGFGFSLHGPQVRIRVAGKAITRLKNQLRVLTRRRWSVPMEYRIGKLNRFITGWMAYFRLADTGNLVRETDRWLRRRLRQVRWKEWKTIAARRHNLRIRGIPERNVRKWGASSKGYWRIAGSQVLGVALPNSYWEHLGLQTMTATRQRFIPAA
jgi:RNA-directed DNA polymerase